jgi:hypothetical protein
MEKPMVWAIGSDAQNAALRELIDNQSSDRVVAIVGGAILEDSLRNALESRFRANVSGHTDINEKLFRVGGPLGNLQPKIDLGYQLYMVEKPVRNAMYGIVEIRNMFAHKLDMRFDSSEQKLSEAAAKITLHEGRRFYPNPLTEQDSEYEIVEPTTEVRDRFLVNLKICLLLLMRDRNLHIQWTNIPMNQLRTSDGAVLPPPSASPPP